MFNVKIVMVFLFGFFFAETLAAQGRPCERVRYSEWVFNYPQPEQEGMLFVANEQALLNPRNVRENDPQATEWMRVNHTSIASAIGEMPHQRFAIFRDEKGETCSELDGIAVIESAPAGPSQVIESGESRRGSNIWRKVASVAMSYGPLATNFLPIPIGIPTSVGLSFASQKLGPKIASGESTTPSKLKAQETKTKKRSKYDHDQNGSFAHLWNQ